MNLEYSAEAENARALFFNVPTVYVEGHHDIPFWTELLRQAGYYSCRIEQVGGSSIRRYEAALRDHECNFFVAMDKDYSPYINEIPDHPNLFLTPCHSIENMLYMPCKIKDFVMRRAALDDGEYQKLDQDILAAQKSFKQKFFIFLYLDILNQIYGKGIKILSQNYKLLNKNCLLQFRNQFSKEEYRSNLHILRKLYRNFFLDIRGHFLEGWVYDLIMKLLKSRKEKIQCDRETLKIFFYECKCQEKCPLYTGIVCEIKHKIENARINKYIESQKKLNV